MVSRLHAEMLSLVPKLRAFAVSLSRDRDQAEDVLAGDRSRQSALAIGRVAALAQADRRGHGVRGAVS